VGALRELTIMTAHAQIPVHEVRRSEKEVLLSVPCRVRNHPPRKRGFAPFCGRVQKKQSASKARKGTCEQPCRTYHSAELRPHLVRHADQNPKAHIGCEQVLVRARGLSSVKVDLFADLVVLESDERVLGVACCVHISEDLERLFVSVAIHEPARGLGEDEHDRAEHGARDRHETERCTPREVARRLGESETDKELHHDPAHDAELLDRHDLAAHAGLGDLGLKENRSAVSTEVKTDGRKRTYLVNGNDSRRNTDL
jgi:hypothetical protein